MPMTLDRFNFDDLLEQGLRAIIEARGNIQGARVKIYSSLQEDYDRAQKLGENHGYEQPTMYGNETEAALFLGRVASRLREGKNKEDLEREFLTHTYNLEKSPAVTDAEREDSRLEREAKQAIIHLALLPENLKIIKDFNI